jgi:phage gp45-like
VLQTSGLSVDTASDLETMKNWLSSSSIPYGVIVCCYTASTTERAEIALLAARSNLAVLQLGCPMQPTLLIAQTVAALS